MEIEGDVEFMNLSNINYYFAFDVNIVPLFMTLSSAVLIR